MEALEDRLVPSAVLWVDDNRAQHPTAPYTSISAAVAAAHSGDTIKVAPGTYREQVVIPAGKDGLQLISDQALQAVITPPAATTGHKALIEDAGSKNITIKGFKIAGPGPGTNGSLNYGILVFNNSSAKITDNTISNIRDEPVSGAQFGAGIAVGVNSSATIEHNTVDHYQKTGIYIDGSGTSADVGFNRVVGIGQTGATAQNGIQISRGATGRVHDNTVSGNVYNNTASDGFVSAGILLASAGAVKVEHNNTFSNQDGILLDSNTGATIKNNSSTGNLLDGIVLLSSDNNTITNNTVKQNQEDGIALFNSHNNQITSNTSLSNGADGIYLDPNSKGNTISKNTLRQNLEFDARDDSTGSGTAGTANTWSHNKGDSSNPNDLLPHHGGKKHHKGHHGSGQGQGHGNHGHDD